MSLTLAKLSYLLIRTVARPVSFVVKRYALKKSAFRSGCVSMAQRFHRLEVKMKGTPLHKPLKNLRPLAEEEAVEIGANFIGEATVFVFFALAILLETNRMRSVERARKEALEEKVVQLEQAIKELHQKIGLK
jgi:hypothetical protein